MEKAVINSKPPFLLEVKRQNDYENNTWFTRTTDVTGIPVRDGSLDPDRISLYSRVEYSGSVSRLAVGEYDATDLQSLGFYENIQSLMALFDYELIVYDG